MLLGVPTLSFLGRHLMQRLFVMLAGLCLIACQQAPQIKQSKKTNELTTVQRMVVTYLSYPQFVHDDFPLQLLGLPVRVEKYRAKAKILYLSLPGEIPDKQPLMRFVKDTSLIQFAREDSSGVFLDPFYFSSNERTYFSIPATSLEIDERIGIRTEVGKHLYEASIAELAAVFSGEMMFNGPALATTNDKNYQGQSYVVGNHCATISPKGEPSLRRLAARIIDSTASRETQAQQLLDFVTREISYTGDAGMEVFRRPTEVLLSKTADCSGKTVLYASLLEQIDYPYLLVYFPRHIALAIPGDFPTKNGMHFEHEGQTYYFAETTFKGFWIGLSYFSPPLREERIKYLQYPGKETRLYDVVNRDSLEFAKKG